MLDYQAAYEYLAGNWYLKYDVELDGNETCRNSTGGLFGLEYYKDGYVECFETDEIWGGLTLAFTFLSGFFWSFHIFYRLWTYLTETDRARRDYQTDTQSPPPRRKKNAGPGVRKFQKLEN